MPSITLLILIFLVAMVYASVGHGGASGYLAAVSLLGYDPVHMASSALVLNLFVAAAVASLALYDMVKAIDPSAMITNLCLLQKTGGRHVFKQKRTWGH